MLHPGSWQLPKLGEQPITDNCHIFKFENFSPSPLRPFSRSHFLLFSPIAMSFPLDMRRIEMADFVGPFCLRLFLSCHFLPRVASLRSLTRGLLIRQLADPFRAGTSIFYHRIVKLSNFSEASQLLCIFHCFPNPSGLPSFISVDPPLQYPYRHN